jgi:SAM-dependent methyltransferase
VAESSPPDSSTIAVVIVGLLFHTGKAVAPRTRPQRAPVIFSPDDEEAGSREAFEDAALYDFEYRRRRADVTFYRRLVADRMAFPAPGPVLDLACGTGRILLPLLRDGHTVVGVERARPMLARAALRVARLRPARRARCLLVRGDLRRLGLRRGFAIALCAFHSVQHLTTDGELVRFFRAVARSLAPGGWFAFDVLPPDPAWLARDPRRRWGRTTFRHPSTGQRCVYSNSHAYDERTRLLHMRLHYQPVDEEGRPLGPERLVRLSHRQLAPDEVRALLARAGFALTAAFGGFDGRPLPDGDEGLSVDEHVYVARLARPTL